MHAFSEFKYKNMQIGNKRIITTYILYDIRARDAKSFNVCVLICLEMLSFNGLRGEGRRIGKIWSRDETYDYIGID